MSDLLHIIMVTEKHKFGDSLQGLCGKKRKYVELPKGTPFCPECVDIYMEQNNREIDEFNFLLDTLSIMADTLNLRQEEYILRYKTKD